MSKSTIAGGVLVGGIALLLVLAVLYPAVNLDGDPVAATRSADSASADSPAGPPAIHPGFIYGRITDVDGVVHQGRLRWGRDQEAFWSDYFNGTKSNNPWAVHAPPAPAGTESSRIEIFGFTIGGGGASHLQRPFLARFGELVRIEPHVRDVKVTLKSGTTVVLDRFAAGDIDDGVRVWDEQRGVVDVDARRIRTIEFLPTMPLVGAPRRLHGTVRTQQGDFTGYIQWDRQDGVGSDELEGRSLGTDVRLRYDTIRTIERRSRDSAAVTLLDGREVVLSDRREVGHDNRGIYVDDPGYGCVLISWEAFERVDFNASDSGSAYDGYPAGRALSGTVTNRQGRRLTGRLVYDFDESETTDTLDASMGGVDYTIPFGLIATVMPHGREQGDARRALVILQDGEELELQRTGDLGQGNAGMLIFVDGGQRPEYLRWADVEQIDFNRAPPTDSSRFSR